MVDYKDLGRRVKQKREAAGLSQAALAADVGLSTQHISNIENAKSKVGLERIVDIANALDSTVDELLCGSIRKSRDIYLEEVDDIINELPDTIVRALPEFLRYLKYMDGLYEKSRKEESEKRD